MATVESSILVDRPADGVWAYLTAPGNLNLFVPGGGQAELQGAALEQGAEVVIRRPVDDQTASPGMTTRVVAWDPPHRVAIAGKQGPLQFAVECTVEATGEGTRITLANGYQASGCLGKLLGLVGVRMEDQLRRALAQHLDSMRSEIEGGVAPG